MTKPIGLVLHISKGRNFPRDPSKSILVEASYGKLQLPSEPVPQQTEPDFNDELVWQTDKESLHSLRLQKAPLKINCFSVRSDRSLKDSLGYIILEARIAAFKDEMRPPQCLWYPLLGGKKRPGEKRPELSLSLHLEHLAAPGPDAIPYKYSQESMPLEDAEKQVYSYDDHLNLGIQLSPEKDNPPPAYCDISPRRDKNRAISTQNYGTVPPTNRSTSPRGYGTHPPVYRNSETDASRRNAEMKEWAKIAEEGERMMAAERDRMLAEEMREWQEDGSVQSELLPPLEDMIEPDERNNAKGSERMDDEEVFTELGAGFLRIRTRTPTPGREEKGFQLTITIVCAKNLEMLIGDFDSSEDYQLFWYFSYMEVDHSSDAFTRVEDPNFNADQTAINIRASSSNLKHYLKKKIFRISLLQKLKGTNQSKLLGVASIELGSLCDTDLEQNFAVIQNGFILIAANALEESVVDLSQPQPVVGLHIKLEQYEIEDEVPVRGPMEENSHYQSCLEEDFLPLESKGPGRITDFLRQHEVSSSAVDSDSSSEYFHEVLDAQKPTEEEDKAREPRDDMNNRNLQDTSVQVLKELNGNRRCERPKKGRNKSSEGFMKLPSEQHRFKMRIQFLSLLLFGKGVEYDGTLLLRGFYPLFHDDSGRARMVDVPVKQNFKTFKIRDPGVEEVAEAYPEDLVECFVHHPLVISVIKQKEKKLWLRGVVDLKQVLSSPMKVSEGKEQNVAVIKVPLKLCIEASDSLRELGFLEMSLSLQHEGAATGGKQTLSDAYQEVEEWKHQQRMVFREKMEQKSKNHLSRITAEVVKIEEERERERERYKKIEEERLQSLNLLITEAEKKAQLVSKQARRMEEEREEGRMWKEKARDLKEQLEQMRLESGDLRELQLQCSLLQKEKREMARELEESMKNKNFFKEQYGTCLRELNKLKFREQKSARQIRYDVLMEERQRQEKADLERLQNRIQAVQEQLPRELERNTVAAESVRPRSSRSGAESPETSPDLDKEHLNRLLANREVMIDNGNYKPTDEAIRELDAHIHDIRQRIKHRPQMWSSAGYRFRE